MHSNTFHTCFVFMRLGSLASKYRPALTPHDIPAMGRVYFLKRLSVKETRDCHLAYLSYEMKILMDDIKTSIVFHSMEI